MNGENTVKLPGKRLVAFAGGAVAAGTTVAAAALLYLNWQADNGNFHEVLAHIVYRSAQPSPVDLARYSADYGIKSVLNLRSNDMSDAERDAERSAAARLGLTEIEFPMKSSQMLSADQVTGLVGILRDAPKPLLIHCRHGSDRTGLAAALYLQDIVGEGEETAEDQLSVIYGHFGIPWLSATYAMDETLENSEPRAGSPGS